MTITTILLIVALALSVASLVLSAHTAWKTRAHVQALQNMDQQDMRHDIINASIYAPVSSEIVERYAEVVRAEEAARTREISKMSERWSKEIEAWQAKQVRPF